MQIALNYPNSLPNFHNTFPRLCYEIEERGPILITRRYMILSAAYICREELITESVDHMLEQVLIENEWRQIGYVTQVR
jgi:hypothetical protein